jgi:hypothetical protein
MPLAKLPRNKMKACKQVFEEIEAVPYRSRG